MAELPSTFDEPATWSRHTFYVSDEMARVFRYLAERERKRLRKTRWGAGQVLDPVMRRYAAEVLSPDELARVLKEGGDADTNA